MPMAFYGGHELVIEYANDAMIALWGKGPGVRGMRLRDALPELEGQPLFGLLDRVFTTGTTYQAKEDRVDLVVGGVLQTFYFSFSYKALRDEQGQVVGIIDTAADVSELVRAREQLAGAQEQLSFALNAADIGTWDLHPASRIVHWDARCRELFGFQGDDEVLYDDVLDCIHPEDLEQVLAAIDAALDPANTGDYDIQYRTMGRKDRVKRWVHCKGKAYFDSDGVAVRFAGIALDVSEAVARRRREEQLLSLVEHNHEHMSIVDLDGHVVYMNAAGRKMVGVGPDEDVTLLKTSDFYTPGELKRLQRLTSGRFLGLAGWQGIIEVRHRQTNEPIPCHVNYIPITDPVTGKVIGRGATARDLRKELQAQRDIGEKNLELEKLLAELRFLSDAVPAVVWTSTADGINDYLNERWNERSHRTAEETLPDGWIASIHPDDHASVQRDWAYAVRTAEPFQVEFRLMDQYGEYRWWLARALALKDESGRVVKWYGTNMDITEQKQVIKQKDSFLGVVSHELKTPLTSIKAYAQVMEKLFLQAADEKNANLMAKLNQQVDRLTRLINDLLEVTKLSAGRVEFTVTTFGFDDLVREIVDLIQLTAAKHRIELRLGYVGQVVADRERVGQVMTNFLTNAIKYSPSADRVIVYTEAVEAGVRFCVKDFGIGINKRHQERVFEQFYRVGGTKECTFPGLGLGLYISAEFVKRMGGRVSVNAEEGQGSLFCFTIPVKSADRNP